MHKNIMDILQQLLLLIGHSKEDTNASPLLSIEHIHILYLQICG